MKTDYKDAEAIAGYRWQNLDDLHFNTVQDWLNSSQAELSWKIAGTLSRTVLTQIQRRCKRERR